MKLILGAICIYLTACGADTSNRRSLDPLQEKAKLYRELLQEVGEEELFLHRCDELTFEGLLSSFGVQRDISGHERVPGLFSRDELPCYAVGDSRSETSPENMVGAMHHGWRWGDKSIAQRIRDYGQLHDWVYGEGDGTQDAPQMEYITNLALTGSYFLTPLDDLEEVLSGYRGYVLLDILYLSLRSSGELSWAEERILESINNPLASGLNLVLDGGYPTELVEIMRDVTLFPEGKLPPETSSLGWGSCPDVVWYLFAADILARR